MGRLTLFNVLILAFEEKTFSKSQGGISTTVNACIATTTFTFKTTGTVIKQSIIMGPFLHLNLFEHFRISVP